jgi:hypothetical protein
MCLQILATNTEHETPDPASDKASQAAGTREYPKNHAESGPSQAGTKQGAKRKAASVCQDPVKSRLLEMAEVKHGQKMKILQLKEDILIMKKQKLEMQLKTSKCTCKNATGTASTSKTADSNNNRVNVWQPYAS